MAYRLFKNAGSRRGVNDIRRRQSLVEIVKCYRDSTGAVQYRSKRV